MSTSNLSRWLKDNRARIIFWGGLVLLVFSSFGVGYLVGQEKDQIPIIIEKYDK